LPAFANCSQRCRRVAGARRPHAHAGNRRRPRSRLFSIATARLLEAEVWGQGFPAPLFQDEFVVESQRILKDKHLKLRLRKGTQSLDAIQFSRSSTLLINRIWKKQIMSATQIKPGVATGDELQAIFELAKAKQFALPAVNVINTSTVNAVMETAKELNSPAIIQFSNGGAQFFAGKGLDNAGQRACIAGGVSGAQHIHLLAELYGATVILHTDHAAKKLLPWIDGLLDAGEQYFKTHGKPLYSSHMLDLSEEPIEENIEICKRYLERMSKMGMTLEIELGVTGGEEDGVDNSGVDSSKLYTQPEDVAWPTKRCPRSATASPSPRPSAMCMASTSRATSSCSRSS
jgi:ketose-bisphosphate aldolase